MSLSLLSDKKITYYLTIYLTKGAFLLMLQEGGLIRLLECRATGRLNLVQIVSLCNCLDIRPKSHLLCVNPLAQHKHLNLVHQYQSFTLKNLQNVRYISMREHLMNTILLLLTSIIWPITVLLYISAPVRLI